MTRFVGLALATVLALTGLTACMGDDDGAGAQQQRRTAALGVSGGTGQEYQLTFESIAPAPVITPPGQAIEVASFAWDAENPTTIGSATGGAGAGKVKFNEFTIQKTVDTASPKLFEAMAGGSHFKKAILSVRKPGAKEAFYEIRFDTVFITSISNSGDNPNVPMENVTFVFGKMETVARGQKEGGSEAPVQAGWDQVTNKKYSGG
jgi:type VI secretion system secreted protein Hcp